MAVNKKKIVMIIKVNAWKILIKLSFDRYFKENVQTIFPLNVNFNKITAGNFLKMKYW